MSLKLAAFGLDPNGGVKIVGLGTDLRVPFWERGDSFIEADLFVTVPASHRIGRELRQSEK